MILLKATSHIINNTYKLYKCKVITDKVNLRAKQLSRKGNFKLTLKSSVQKFYINLQRFSYLKVTYSAYCH